MSKSKEMSIENEKSNMLGANTKQSAQHFKSGLTKDNEKKDKDSNKGNPWGPLFKNRDHFNSLHNF